MTRYTGIMGASLASGRDGYAVWFRGRRVVAVPHLNQADEVLQMAWREERKAALSAPVGRG